MNYKKKYLKYKAKYLNLKKKMKGGENWMAGKASELFKAVEDCKVICNEFANECTSACANKIEGMGAPPAIAQEVAKEIMNLTMSPFKDAIDKTERGVTLLAGVSPKTLLKILKKINEINEINEKEELDIAVISGAVDAAMDTSLDINKADFKNTIVDQIKMYYPNRKVLNDALEELEGWYSE